MHHYSRQLSTTLIQSEFCRWPTDRNDNRIRDRFPVVIYPDKRRALIGHPCRARSAGGAEVTDIASRAYRCPSSPTSRCASSRLCPP
jgi:hypothetical protein